ncbi:MAG TPA: HD domain-containing phosphohydrolase [Thermoanaerobaculia bacterium]|nr:HD domain-containing phosphohydrolase [Thermoanaerobaculia bacterium]
MDIELVIIEGSGMGRTYSVRTGDSKTLGRGPDCDIDLYEQGVSRRHCTVENSGFTVTVTDLESVNGTFVNGKPVRRGRLQAGDELAVGPVVLTCRAQLLPLPGPGALDEQAKLVLREDESPSLVRKVVDTAHPSPEPASASPEALQRAQRNLATAYEVSGLIVRAADMRSLLQSIIDAIFQSIAADRAALLLRSPGGEGPDSLRIVAARSRRPDTGSSSSFTISRTVVHDVLENHASFLSWDAGADERLRGGESVIQQRIRAVICAPVAAEKQVLGVLYADNLTQPGAFIESDLDLLALIGNQAGMAIQRARLQDELEQSFFDTIRAIVATIDAKDGYTHRHSERVATFAVRLAREMGRETDELVMVRLAAMVHDVGKVGVPEAILNKPGRLTEAEFDQMKLHPIHGANILRHIHSPMLERILPGVLAHHERWDGSGYPRRLAGSEIPFLGRLLAVADVLDALSSGRPYRDSVSFPDAIELLRLRAGIDFDPEIVEAAVRLHERGELEVPPESLEANDISGSESSIAS